MAIDKFKEKLNSRETKIAIVGFGYIGTCIGAVLAHRGFKVVGVDTNAKIIEEINNGYTSIREPGLSELVASSKSNLSATKDFSVLSESDVIIVTVGTPLNSDFSPNNEQIIAASEAMVPYLNSEQVIILKSTVPPNTTKDIVAPILSKGVKNSNLLLSFCPERLAEGKAIEEFNQFPVIVGGIDKQSTDFSSEFWKRAMNLETILMSNSTASELVKLADNLWIDLNIALANEIAMLSDNLGVNAQNVIDAANTLPKGQGSVNILFPGIGVGGYCLTKDPWFVYHLGKKYNLDLKTPQASRGTNELMPAYSFGRIKESLLKNNKKIEGAKVSVLGISFKDNTGDCRFTPTVPIINMMQKSGMIVEVFDPWVDDTEIKQLLPDVKISKSIESSIGDVDCLVFLAAHDEFREIEISSISKNNNSDLVVFDGRGLFSRDEQKQLLNLGFTYVGVGR